MKFDRNRFFRLSLIIIDFNEISFIFSKNISILNSIYINQISKS